MSLIEFFFDLSSPYSYLASTQLDGLLARTGATLEPRPFVLAAVFKASENPAPREIAIKARYMARDVPAWARTYGVPFVWSDKFPLNAMKAHRVLVALDDPAARWSLTKRLFRAFWGEDRDLADPSVLAELVAAHGLDAPALLAATESPPVKDRLRANTDSAIERGAYGAPSFFVNGEYFIGNDRLAFVERAARGERLYV
jgi:2-hydroxychromene-2-carboxylate isomerase